MSRSSRIAPTPITRPMTIASAGSTSTVTVAQIDDQPGYSDRGGGRRAGESVQEHRAHVQVLGGGVGAEDENADYHDPGRNHTDDQDREPVDVRRALGQPGLPRRGPGA